MEIRQLTQHHTAIINFYLQATVHINVKVKPDKLYVLLSLAFFSQCVVYLYKGPSQNNAFRSFMTQKREQEVRKLLFLEHLHCAEH